MSLTIRPAQLDDVPALVAADPFAMAHAGRRVQIAIWVDSGQCFVADRDGDVLGYAVLTRNFFQSFFIELVAVHEGARRSGVGTALVEHLAANVPPGEKLWTSTNVSNAAMRALLARSGFIESGRLEHLDEGDPEIVLVRLP